MKNHTRNPLNPLPDSAFRISLKGTRDSILRPAFPDPISRSLPTLDPLPGECILSRAEFPYLPQSAQISNVELGMGKQSQHPGPLERSAMMSRKIFLLLVLGVVSVAAAGFKAPALASVDSTGVVSYDEDCDTDCDCDD